jgi:hypothetical protein
VAQAKRRKKRTPRYLAHSQHIDLWISYLPNPFWVEVISKVFADAGHRVHGDAFQMLGVIRCHMIPCAELGGQVTQSVPSS